MKMLHLMVVVSGLLLSSLTAHPARADVFSMPDGQKSLEFVTVGDPGNAADIDWGHGRLGAVSYTYKIGKYDVTAAQYCQFLNAVAAMDPYRLYDPNMANPPDYPDGYYVGCGIVRTGSSGIYRYSVIPERENFPVNWVNWASAARFTNWLSNGQPFGVEGPGTTETGSYTLNGAMSNSALQAVTRNSGAIYALPTENEWYKAAFYKGGSKNARYWNYTTRSAAQPSNVLSAIGTNNANYWNSVYTDHTHFLTPVGAFAGSPGPYGTFDQGGNVWQWNETAYGSYRGLRGGAFFNEHWSLRRDEYFSSEEPSGVSSEGTGFRVALVPEPASLAMLAISGLLVARRRAD
jgi:formylglycine-generating enzyme required for sulfatase activity